MIDISTALQNILKAVYGRDVRESIHDAIFQINANANEAIDLAQIKFGTAVNSPTDPITGFAENSVYLNVNTGIMWRLEGGSWVKKGTFKSIDSISLSGTSGLIDTYTITFTDGSTSNYTVKNGEDGKSITGITKTSTSGNVDHYDVNLSDGTTTSGFDVTNGTNGTDGKSIANISLASTSGNVKNYDVFLDDGTKTPTGFSVEDGASSYLHIRYSSSFDGTGMVTTPTDATVYIGILVSTSSVAPTNPSLYNWVRFIGKSGTGSGDMLASDYATKYPNTVDKAAALYDGTDEILANQLMKKSVYDADDDGVVDNANHAVSADNVGNADTSLLENLSDNSGKLNYNGNALMLEMAQLANQAKLGEFVVNKIGNNVKELALHSNITTKLSKSVPTTSDAGKVATVQSDGTVDWDTPGTSNLVHLHISYEPSLAGATITATNGNEVKTAVADSTGLTVINCTKLGEWTITEDMFNTSAVINTEYYGNYNAGLGGGVKITVEFESAFVGKTLTLTNGSKTYTRLASGTSVLFVVADYGTWTVSAEVDGQTYSDSTSVTSDGEYSMSLSLEITKNITFYSAPNETIKYKRQNSNEFILLNTADETGKGSGTITYRNGETITFSGNIAKDTTNGTSAYTKEVTINSTTSEIYVMPDGAIYWHGYQRVPLYVSDIFIGDDGNNYNGYCSTNTNNIKIGVNISYARAICQTDDLIDLSKYTKLRMLSTVTGNSQNKNLYTSYQKGNREAFHNREDDVNYPIGTNQITDLNLTKTDSPINCCVSIVNSTTKYSGECIIYALWLE